MNSLQGLPLRTSLRLPIFAMGGVSIALVLVTSHIYRDLTIEDRRQAIQQVIELKSKAVLVKLADDSRHLAAGMQRDPEFIAAEEQKKQAILTEYLNQQFHRYFNTAGGGGVAKTICAG